MTFWYRCCCCCLPTMREPASFPVHKKNVSTCMKEPEHQKHNVTHRKGPIIIIYIYYYMFFKRKKKRRRRRREIVERASKESLVYLFGQKENVAAWRRMGMVIIHGTLHESCNDDGDDATAKPRENLPPFTHFFFSFVPCSSCYVAMRHWIVYISPLIFVFFSPCGFPSHNVVQTPPHEKLVAVTNWSFFDARFRLHTERNRKSS